MFTCASKYFSTLTILYRKCYWLFCPSVHSLSPDNAMEKKKSHENAAQKKINLKALWGPFLETSLGAPGKYPLLLIPLGGPGCQIQSWWESVHISDWWLSKSFVWPPISLSRNYCELRVCYGFEVLQTCESPKHLFQIFMINMRVVAHATGIMLMHDELVWVNKWYNPDDLRSSAPVQRHKFLAQPLPELSSLPSYWVPLCEAPLKSFSRAAEEKHIHVSSPSSRCEEWSTLRQMLPSKGQCKRCSHPKWGTGMSTPPTWSTKNLKRFPHINSPMTEWDNIIGYLG